MKNHLPDFTDETIAWFERTALSRRQQFGQFMTPRALRGYLLEQLSFFPGARVLDPGVGTGEFLRQAREICPQIQTFGWDIDSDILSIAKKNDPDAVLMMKSALEGNDGDGFDFIIGNPPYFELTLERDLRERFRAVINGRANIYALFIKAALDALKPGGTLAFVVPPSMNAGAYFKNLRKFIVRDHRVVSLKVFKASDLFVDAQTSVQILVIKKEPGQSNNVAEFQVGAEKLPFFFEKPEEVRELFQGSRTLWDLGFEAVTGTVIWNKFKAELSNSPSDTSKILYYARNIQNGLLEIRLDPKKPQFMTQWGGPVMVGPAILVNRIVGGVGRGVINSGLVASNEEFLAENHLNVIRPRANAKQHCSIETLIDAIRDPSTLEAARLITGNTQLSATEWNYLIPFKF